MLLVIAHSVTSLSFNSLATLNTVLHSRILSTLPTILLYLHFLFMQYPHSAFDSSFDDCGLMHNSIWCI